MAGRRAARVSDTVYDLVVVGGGPAGATAARYAARGGLSVLIVDKKSELGTPVQCSGAVSASALRECEVPLTSERGALTPGKTGRGPSVAQHGADSRELSAAEFIAEPIYGFRTWSNEGEAVGVDYRAHGRAEPLGYVVDRKRFDRCLTRLALDAGAELWLKTRALGFSRHDGLLSVQLERFGQREVVSARVIVGADGIMSQVGLWAGLHVAIPPADLASCLQYIVTNVETSGLLEIVTGHDHAPGGYAWVFPKGNGLAEVGLGVARTRTAHDARWHLDRFMSESFMRERFRSAQVVEVQGGGVPLAAALRQMVADNVLVVGDAARQVNPITGGGIHTALRAGRIAGEFLAAHLRGGGGGGREELEGYQARWRREQGAALAELYRVKRRIFRGSDLARQDRALFETMSAYFSPASSYRKV